MDEHKPYVDPEAKVAELTPRAVVLGAFFGLMFGAVTVYLALKVGLTVSASIPIAVLSIMIFRKLGKSTILENNIVQTIGSAGESIASGVVFTLPALIFLNSPLPYHRILLVALGGGFLGILMMIPLRRALIVKEHQTLRYPEGTACANILVAGEKGGSLAGKVFAGLGIGVLYRTLQSIGGLWKESPGFVAKKFFRGFALSVDASPELLGVGYIVGFRTACIIVAGGLLSWTVLIPFVKFLGAGVATPIFPATVPIAQMTPAQIWGSYIRYIGAGGVAAGGVINLARAMPTIIGSFRDSIRSMRGAGPAGELRTERDLPITVVAIGTIILAIGLWILFTVDVNPGHPLANAGAAVLLVLYGFFFVTVSSRVVGMIGSSNNPISGDTITTLMGTCLLFVLVGWTGHAWAAVALSIGAVVCVAAANAGATSQDLKTGFLVGATPRSQQLGLMVGVVAATLVIGVTLNAMNEAYHTIEPAHAAEGFKVASAARKAGSIDYRGKTYTMIYLDDAQDTAGLPDGKYLVDNGQVVFRYVDGIGGRTLSAPQARLMSLVVSGILNQKLPWTLVLLGIFIGIVVELCGVHALPFAVGLYLPLSTTTPVFFGGLMKLISDKLHTRKTGQPPPSEEEASEGTLFSSGLIAGGALMGVGIAALILMAGRFQPLANGMEFLRGDGLKIDIPDSCSVSAAGKTLKNGDSLAVRSRWFEHELQQPDGSMVKKKELLPAFENGEPFETLPMSVSCPDGAKDSIAVDYDSDSRARILKFHPVDVWQIPLTGNIEEWLVKVESDVGYGQKLAKLAGGGELRAPQDGRIHQLTSTGAMLETRDPPAGQQKPPEAISAMRLELDARPSSDAGAMAIFLLLCAVLVWSALPRSA